MFGRNPAVRPPNRDQIVLPSPALDDDMYGQQVPLVVEVLITYLEGHGMHRDALFAGDPSIRSINDTIDALGSPDADVDYVVGGDSHLAGSTVAAYLRQLPEALIPSPTVEQMFGALECADVGLRVAQLRDAAAELGEASQAVLHRLFYFLAKLGVRAAHGNSLADLAAFWSAILLPTAGSRGLQAHPRAHRVKEFRLVALLLQHCAPIFQGALETLDLEELPLPKHLQAEEAEAEARSKSWVKVKGSLLKDSVGQFKVVVKQDQDGIYLDKVACPCIRVASL